MATQALEETKAKLTHLYIRERREAITRLGELLQVPEDRAEALQLLKEKAENDPITTMRDLAQQILDEDAKKNPERRLGEGVEHMFGVKCPKCQYVTWFDKREVCNENSEFYRTVIAGQPKTLDKLSLPCEQCGTRINVKVDCEGYR